MKFHICKIICVEKYRGLMSRSRYQRRDNIRFHTRDFTVYSFLEYTQQTVRTWDVVVFCNITLIFDLFVKDFIKCLKIGITIRL